MAFAASDAALEHSRDEVQAQLVADRLRCVQAQSSTSIREHRARGAPKVVLSSKFANYKSILNSGGYITVQLHDKL